MKKLFRKRNKKISPVSLSVSSNVRTYDVVVRRVYDNSLFHYLHKAHNKYEALREAQKIFAAPVYSLVSVHEDCSDFIEGC